VEHGGSLSCSQEPVTGLQPDPDAISCATFCKKLFFYDEWLLAPRPHPKLEGPSKSWKLFGGLRLPKTNFLK